MPSSRLTPLQHRILEVLRAVPGWALSGGGALVGFHLGHRTTRDLDLFFHGLRQLDREPRDVEDALVAQGLGVAALQRSPGFVRLSVEEGGDERVRDLEDVRALVGAGGDLERALADAPRKDGGFSPMTLAWLLPQLPVGEATVLGFDEAALRAFRDALVARLTA